MSIDKTSLKIYEALMFASYVDEANEIKSLMGKVLTLSKSDSERLSAIESLLLRCHPKWLGDCYVKNNSYNEWMELIAKFKKELSKLK
ncbi:MULTISPECIES: hypothetical protein [Pantoea]|jgi:hypothetical protein|nr:MULTISPECIES: hypothetical protein [Pantoea]MDN4133352.1 hypothetical protein [Pantoea ananatis]NCU08446.1 hypothetical protein [Pantoea ananatis]PQK78258.1 hypothetical protein CG427_02250 [Pantoea ananatis]PWW14608.1 hypothetical protein DFO57_10463 [Pantoea sp. AG702]RQN07205.1 hypothetical protein EHQ51_21145 [Pantoea ananatis]